MSSIHLWYPPFHHDCAQVGRSSAQAIHSHPQVCAQSGAGKFSCQAGPRVAPGADRGQPGYGHRRGAEGGLACRMGARGVSAWSCRAARMSARGPCGDLRLFAGCESAQLLKNDQCLPSDDHRQGGHQALEACVRHRGGRRLTVRPPQARIGRRAAPGAPCGGCGTIPRAQHRRRRTPDASDSRRALRRIHDRPDREIPGALGAPALCSRADGVAFGAQGWGSWCRDCLRSMGCHCVRRAQHRDVAPGRRGHRAVRRRLGLSVLRGRCGSAAAAGRPALGGAR